ncbi:uncharacterized protein PgNI_11753 [Pyricularia grisea]|uniref:Uncharacterized protein n=1 Tax=Pyricularia grisea TaxID=148305 RepID=A0A6P8ANB8_PYRGI|nr:uncharacterized protein PgNI_11753 [Pyricularia grisea]TLD03537.1 hypothetical protein PgNI_11753 [Pyricularia grisea]
MSRGQAGELDHASQSANCHVCICLPNGLHAKTYSCRTPSAAVGTASLGAQSKKANTELEGAQIQCSRGPNVHQSFGTPPQQLHEGPSR